MPRIEVREAGSTDRRLRATRPTRRSRMLAWAAIAVAVIAGLLGMHALDMDAAMPTHADPAERAVVAGSTPDPPVGCGGCDAEVGMTEGMACVLALLAALLLLARARPVSWPIPAARVPSRRSQPGRTRLDQHPSLYELLVIRT